MDAPRLHITVGNVWSRGRRVRLLLREATFCRNFDDVVRSQAPASW